MHLLVDNSNTRTKFALAADGVVAPPFSIIPTADLSEHSIRDVLAGHLFTQTTVCSVVPQAAEVLEKTIPGPLHQLTYRSPLPITIDYPRPDQIGADRLANAAAVATTDPNQAAIVIDFGTAVTFDVLSAENAYLGGVIAPGTAALRDYLHQKTALLPAITFEEPKTAIGRSTEAAMLSGAIHGYRGLIANILEKIIAELPGPAVIYATGGDAPLLTKDLPRPAQVDPLLTLKGIDLVSRAAFSS